MSYYLYAERLDIGKRVFSKEIDSSKAASIYDITLIDVDEYVKDYIKSIRFDPIAKEKPVEENKPGYESMTKEELIKVIMKKI